MFEYMFTIIELNLIKSPNFIYIYIYGLISNSKYLLTNCLYQNRKYAGVYIHVHQHSQQNQKNNVSFYIN